MLLHAVSCARKRVGKSSFLLIACILSAVIFPAVSSAQMRPRSNLRKRIPFPTQNKSVEITISPSTASVVSGGDLQFQAAVKNSSNTGVVWSASQGSVTGNGVFTSPKLTEGATLTITATSAADSRKSASASISVIPAVSLQVLFPPMRPRQAYSSDVRTYLMNNSAVSGAILAVQWSTVDKGPGVIPQYDWSGIDADIQQWLNAGKKVNLVVWAISDTPVNNAMPQYVWNDLGTANQTTCSGQQIPNYFNSAFQVPYQQFMRQVVQHYAQNPGIGYIRFGLGRGGETNMARGFGSESVCTDAFMSWGWSETAWIDYLNSMLNYEASLNSPKRLMVGLVGTNWIRNAPHAVAATAVPAHIGIGSQGLAASDITNYPSCTSHWCDLFETYLGQVPLELQPVELSDPSGKGLTGSLVPLIPFAIEHHAQVLEIFWQDWLLAFDPAYPGNDQYGAAYAQALRQASATGVQ